MDNETEPKPKNHGALKKFVFFLKLLEIRLRFVLILVVTAVVVGYWDNIQNYYERWQRNREAAAGHAPGAREMHGAEAVSKFEFFCPMHPFVIRGAKGKCPVCGMDLVQRKKGAPMELPEGVLTRVQVSPERVMQAGIQVEPVSYRLLIRTVRTYGVVEPDETRVARIIARFPGRIDDLMVAAVGLTVKKGEPLAKIYSPKFLAAAQEYLQAQRSERRAASDSKASVEEKRRATELTSYARERLLLAGFTDKQIKGLKDRGEPANTVTLYSPLAGTVLEKNALLGESVEEGSSLYTIADLSQVWVQALAIESDLSAVKMGMAVEVSTVSYPGEIFYGTVDFIYPTVDPLSRSVKVRVVVDNAAAKLKPGMYANAVMRSPIGRYGPAESFKTDEAPEPDAASPNESRPPVGPPSNLPTETQEDAERLMASLSSGAEYYQCPMDLEVVSDKPADCPKCGMHLERKTKGAELAEHAANAGHAIRAAVPESGGADRPSTEQWAEGYSCPMHPDELASEPGICKVCPCGMKTAKVRIERVVSVPETAVIDTGTRYVVYAESSPGVFDAREVKLGPRAGAFYPVLDGVALGDRIVSRGSFLIDAEARLNPAVTAGAAGSVPAEHQHP